VGVELQNGELAVFLLHRRHRGDGAGMLAPEKDGQLPGLDDGPDPALHLLQAAAGPGRRQRNLRRHEDARPVRLDLVLLVEELMCADASRAARGPLRVPAWYVVVRSTG
jgi:hypothetical protein